MADLNIPIGGGALPMRYKDMGDGTYAEVISDTLSSPASGAFSITKSDETVFINPTRGLWVGGAGNVAVRMLDGTLPIFVGVTAGAFLPIRVDKVLSTGTSATNIVGLY